MRVGGESLKLLAGHDGDGICVLLCVYRIGVDVTSSRLVHCLKNLKGIQSQLEAI